MSEIATVHTLLPNRSKELVRMLDRAIMVYQSDGGTYEDAVSSTVGYFVGLTMRDFGWTPEQVAENVRALADQIVAALPPSS